RRAVYEAELLRTGYVQLKFSIEGALHAQNQVSLQLNHIIEAKNPSDAKSWIETERRVRPKTFVEIRAVAHGFAPADDERARALSGSRPGRDRHRTVLAGRRRQLHASLRSARRGRFGSGRASAKRARFVRSRGG